MQLCKNKQVYFFHKHCCIFLVLCLSERPVQQDCNTQWHTVHFRPSQSVFILLTQRAGSVLAGMYLYIISANIFFCQCQMNKPHIQSQGGSA